MNKKTLALLLALCLIIGLLPVMAIADGGDLATPYILRFGFNNYELKKYDTPLYIKNGTVDTQDTAQNAFTAYVPTASGANASNWNAKLEWKSGEAGPTLTLNGLKYDDFNNATGLWKYRGEGFDLTDHAQTTAITSVSSAPLTIVITGEDSLLETKFGISYAGDLTIKSEGAAKLDINAMSGGIFGADGASLTIDANLDVDVASYYSSTMMVLTSKNADITINGGNVNLTGTSSLVALKPITSGNVNINGGNVYAKGGYRGANVAEGNKLNMNGGSLTLIGSYSAIYEGTAKGVVTIPDGADVEIKTGTKTDGSNAAVRETIASAIYVQITYKTVPPVETTAPATESSAPSVETSAPSVETSAPSVETTAPTAAPSVPATGEALSATVTVKFGFDKLVLTNYDKPVYRVNASKQTQDVAGNAFTKWAPAASGANEDNYNAKLIWNTGDAAPTLILRGFKYDEINNATGKMESKYDSATESYTGASMQTYAITTDKTVPLTIILTGEDSLIECQFGITYYNDLTIKSEGNAKLVMNNASSGIASNNTEGAELTIDANLELFKTGYYNIAYGGALLQTYKADLTINGGNIVVTTTADKSVAGIAARDGGNVIINGGNISAHGVAGTSATNGSITATGGKVIIKGGTVKATAAAAVGIYGKTGIEINGGAVQILNAPYYGMNVGTADAPADIVINGGSYEYSFAGSGAGGAFYKAPVLGAGVDGLAGPNEDEADFYDETKYNAKWVKLTYTAPGGSTPSNPSNPGGSTTPSNPSNPGGSTTPSTPSNPNNPATGDSSVAMFVAMMLVAVFGIVATVSFSKKRTV